MASGFSSSGAVVGGGCSGAVDAAISGGFNSD